MTDWHKAAGLKLTKGVNDCNGESILQHVPNNETEFPICRATDSLWHHIAMIAYTVLM